MKTTLTIIILILLTFFTSCIKEPNCRGDDINEGAIIDNYDLPDCYYYSDTVNTHEYIILSADDLDTIDNCTPDPLTIDFSQHSIIGMWVSGQCELKVIRKLTIDNTKKEYLYSMTVRECGLCKLFAHDFQLVLVPAIPNDYTVRFEVEYK